MTIEEAIKRAEETAIGEDELCKRYDRASGYSRNHDETIRTIDAKRCEKIAQEHRQLAEWLKDYKRLLENSSEIPTGSTNTISFKEMTDNLKITADDIENAEDLEYSIEPLVHPKNDLGVEDCVSRAEVLKLMKDNWHTHNGDWAMQESMDDIRALPSVTPIRPKGHWIKTSKAVMGEGYMWYCDKCKHQVYQDSSRDYPSEKFCPSCGSDNREVEE